MMQHWKCLKMMAWGAENHLKLWFGGSWSALGRFWSVFLDFEIVVRIRAKMGYTGAKLEQERPKLDYVGAKMAKWCPRWRLIGSILGGFGHSPSDPKHPKIFKNH